MRIRHCSVRLAIYLFAVQALLAASAGAAPPAITDYSKLFRKTGTMVPMRDGVRLQTEVYVPKKVKEPLPFIFERTPYGLEDDNQGYTKLLRAYEDLIGEGYIFVFQDIRGRYKSEGQFVMNRPPRDKSASKAIDESTDTYDTIDWLIKNVPRNNGRVGLLGFRIADG